MGVFELAEGELGLGLGAVAGHHLGDRPVLAVGDQDTFTKTSVSRLVRAWSSMWFSSGHAERASVVAPRPGVVRSEPGSCRGRLRGQCHLA